MKVSGSKNIAAIDYEDGTLTTTFTNGRKYAYADVPEGVYEELVAQVQSTDPEASVGKTFNRLVRQGGYDFSEVTE